MENDRKDRRRDWGNTLIDKTDDSDLTRREEYWGKILKTVARYGLNKML